MGFKKIEILRQNLRREPTNLDAAFQYWNFLGNCEGHDLRSGMYVVEAFGAAALKDKAGVKALADAYRDLFRASGEVPRAEFFDEKLTEALKSALQELSGTEHSTVEWLLTSIGVL